MNHNQIRKIDDKSESMEETTKSCDKCFCNFKTTPEDERKNVEAFKKPLSSFNSGKKRRNVGGRRPIDIPLVFVKGEQGVYTSKEVVKRKFSFGGCGCCNKENVLPKHSFTNIYVTNPELAPLCPCPMDNDADKQKRPSNIKVTIDNVTVDPDSENSEASLQNHRLQRNVKEPKMSEKKSVTCLINAQYERDENSILELDK